MMYLFNFNLISIHAEFSRVATKSNKNRVYKFHTDRRIKRRARININHKDREKRKQMKV